MSDEGSRRTEPVKCIGLLLGLGSRRGQNSSLHGDYLQALQLVQLVDESGLVPEGAATSGSQLPPDLIELDIAPFSLQVDQKRGQRSLIALQGRVTDELIQHACTW